MTELPRQSDRLPLAELISAVRDAKRAEAEADAMMRPLWREYGRARSELAVEIILGLLGGDSPSEWEAALTELGFWPWDTNAYGAADGLGRELSNWLRFQADGG